MSTKNLSIAIVRAVVILCILAAMLLLVYEIKSVITYLVISLIFSLVTNPLVVFLSEKLKLKNTVSVVLSFIIVSVLFFLLAMMFIPLIVDQSNNLSLLDLGSIKLKIERLYENLIVFFSQYDINFETLFNIDSLKKVVNFSFIPQVLNSSINFLSQFGMGLATVFFISFFLLKDKRLFFKLFVFLLPSKERLTVIKAIDNIKGLLTRYFIGLLTQAAINFSLYLIIFLVFGIENAFVIAFLCAILNVIPYLGPLLGMVIASVLILISGLGDQFFNETVYTTLYVVIGMFCVQLIDNNFTQPRIFSQATKSHPLEIFLVILISGILYGVVGMIVAVPMYTVLKVIGKFFMPKSKFVQILTQKI